MAAGKFPDAICRCIGAQFVGSDLIALFELSETGGKVAIEREKHYRLVPGDDVTAADLTHYRAVWLKPEWVKLGESVGIRPPG